GEIARAYFLAQELAADDNTTNDLSAEQILALHQQGQGWGQIVQAVGLPHGNRNRNLGQIMSGHGKADDATAQPMQNSSPIPTPSSQREDQDKDKGGNTG